MKTTLFRAHWILPLLVLFALPAAVQAQFDFVTNNGSITITGYTGHDPDVTIPDTITGLPVTTIGDMVFYQSSTLANITIGTNVTTIGRSAFIGCSNLTSVTIGTSVTSIGNWAFYGCIKLTSVTIPASVTAIGAGAFESCNGLTSVAIPSSVTYIGDRAFRYCITLAAITVDAANSCYSSLDGVLFNKSQTTLIQFPSGRAGSYAIPNGVTNIGIEAFFYCTRLTSVTIPNSVISIGYNVFWCCFGLTSVTIPDSVTTLGDWAFYYCSGLTNLTISKSVTSIGEMTFRFCTNLTSIAIPNSVTSIGGHAFEYCYTLTAVYFCGNAPTLGVSVFESDAQATLYHLPGTMDWGPTYGGRPTAIWQLPYPVILNLPPFFGLQTNRFGFRVSWATNGSVIADACTDVATPLWFPVATNNITMGSDPLTDGWTHFSDPDWTNHPARFYRVRSP